MHIEKLLANPRTNGEEIVVLSTDENSSQLTGVRSVLRLRVLPIEFNAPQPIPVSSHAGILSACRTGD